MHIEFWSQSFKGRDNLGKLALDGRIKLECI